MKPTNLLVILDGWGYSPRNAYNAIKQASTPTWDTLWKHSPRALLDASAGAVGLPTGQMGNSEVGHMTIGAGRLIEQELTRIDREVRQGNLRQHPVILDLVSTQPKLVHVIGLLSPGGVHSHESHIHALVAVFAEFGVKVCVHAILDGRDTPPQSAEHSIESLHTQLERNGWGYIGSIVGRYYAMDRDQRWDRTKLAYELLTEGKSDYSSSNPVAALRAAYARGETDEFVKPTWIHASAPVEDDHAVLFMNFRADRIRQLARAFILEDFDGFKRNRQAKLKNAVLLTPYAVDIDQGSSLVPVATLFHPISPKNTLGECVANASQTQLRIAETEKYAHVTLFFSGGSEVEFPNEHRAFVPSPKIATYDLEPQMSAKEITRQITDAIDASSYDFIVANLANGDMVGHTGNFAAAKIACETIDQCLLEISTVVRRTHSHCLVTADHGNVECLKSPHDTQPHTAHTLNLVPLIYVGNEAINLRARGTLADIAPTLLQLSNLEIPAEMTGRSLLT